MMTSSTLDLELDLIRGETGLGLSQADRIAIQSFVAVPSMDNWIAAGNVVITTDGAVRVSLAKRLVETFKHYLDGTFFTIAAINGPSMWHAVPDTQHIVAILKSLTKTDALPSIMLELSLARGSGNKLGPSERRALERLYYQPTIDNLIAAKDIVLLEDGHPDGGELTFIEALAAVSPEWMTENVGEEHRGGRPVKVFRRAPSWKLTYSALVRATH
jgi:hypothetical protein